MLRKLLFSLVGAVVVGLGIFAVAQRDTAATHPALINLPPLIPVREFYASLGVEWAFEPASDGRLVSFWTSTISGNILTVRNLVTGQDLAELPDAEWAYWSPREPLLRVWADGRLWEADPHNPARENWKDVSPRGVNSWQISSESQTAEGRNLVLSYDRSDLWPDIYTTDTSGRDLQLLAKNDGTILFWLMDSQQRLIGRMVLADDDSNRLQRADAAGQFTEILRIDPKDDFDITDISADGSSFVAWSNIGTDKIAMVSLDVATGAITPLGGFDQVDVSYTYDLRPFDGQVDLIVGDGLLPEYQALTPAGKILLKKIRAEGETVDVSYLVTGGGGRYVTTTLSPDAKSYIYRHFDLTSGKATDLGTYGFRQDHLSDLAPTNGSMVTARDGLALPVFVTRPKGVSAPGPTVIEVHGGPEYHRRWEYSHHAQFLANRGYTVISVNYRGSNGWGRAYREAGHGEFGTKIQEDIVDVATWAVEQGLADPAAMAVMGDSFGGYSTVMALTREDNPFKAGLAIVPMLDVEFQTRNAPAFWGLEPQGWARYFGDHKDPAQAQVMKDRSPVNLADKVSAPLLVLAGRQDQVVNIEQVERFDEAMRAAGRPLQLHIFSNEGHGWDNWKTQVVEARLTEDFLAQHLGGRSGGWDWIEWAAEWID